MISTLASCLGISDGWFFNNPIKTPLWYISVLLWCYIVFYCIVYITKKIFKKQLFIFLLSGFVIMVGIVIVSLHLDLPFLNDDMSRGYLAFFTGIILAELLNRIDVTKLFYQLTALLLICLYCILKVTGLNIPVESYVVIFILWPSVLVLLKSSFLVSIYNAKVLEYLADCSFDAYVWHMTVLEVLLVLFKKFGVSILNSFIGMIISLIIVSVIAIISNKFINKPISKKLQSVLFEK